MPTYLYIVIHTLRKKCYWIKSISNQKHVYHGFKSICYRISNIFIGSCSIFLWINSIHAFGNKCFWFNSIFSQCIYIVQCTLLSVYAHNFRFYAVKNLCFNFIKLCGKIHSITWFLKIRYTEKKFSWKSSELYF